MAMAGYGWCHDSKLRWEGEETGENPTDRGKIGTKRSVLTDAQGVPVALTVSGANVHDKRLVREPIESIPIERPKASPKQPQHLCQDKGYDYTDVRELVAEFGYTAHIPKIGSERNVTSFCGCHGLRLNAAITWKLLPLRRLRCPEIQPEVETQ